MIFAQSVQCDHNSEHRIPAKKVRLIVEYYNKDGNRTAPEEMNDAGFYGDGSNLNGFPVTGQLVHLKLLVPNKTDYGCSEIDKDKVPSSGPWVALVQRGECNFNQKLYYAAKRSNASAVIVYNLDKKSLDQTLTVRGLHDGRYSLLILFLKFSSF